MDHQQTYLLCFPDFPCKSFKLKDLGLLIAYLVIPKDRGGTGEGGGGYPLTKEVTNEVR